MKVSELGGLLQATILSNTATMDLTLDSAFASDLMSDVLAFATNQSVLVTGLVNQQVVRTSEMMDIRCIVFVNNKEPQEEIVALANELHIAVISTEKNAFEVCGIIYQAFQSE